MSDGPDDAEEMIALHTSHRIAQASFEASKHIEVSKTCYECAVDTLNGARWCSAECRDVWELRVSKVRPGF